MGKAKKEKYAAKVASRAAANVQPVMPPVQKRNVLESLPIVLPNTKERVNKCNLAAYVSLSMFEHERGNRQAFRELLSRLALGRLVAQMYFADEDAANIHLGVRVLINTVGKQEESDVMSLNQQHRDAIAICLATIDDMQMRITEDQYTVAVYQFGIDETVNAQFTYEAVHDVSWEQYKIESGWTTT
jgi:hypothetical protein